MRRARGYSLLLKFTLIALAVSGLTIRDAGAEVSARTSAAVGEWTSLAARHGTVSRVSPTGQASVVVLPKHRTRDASGRLRLHWSVVFDTTDLVGRPVRVPASADRTVRREVQNGAVRLRAPPRLAGESPARG